MTHWSSANDDEHTPDDEYQLGDVDPRVTAILSLAPSASIAWMHAVTLRHIKDRRANANDAEFVLRHLSPTVVSPEIVCTESRDPRRLRFVKFVPEANRHVHVSLKLVESSVLGAVEYKLWVSSAYPLGLRSLTRLLKRENFHIVG